MWWKKLLYVITAMVLGAGTTAIVMTASFHSVFVDTAREAAEGGDYDLSQSFYYYVSSKPLNRYLVMNFPDGMHFEIQPAIVKQPHYFYDDVEQKMKVGYETIEEAIGFSLFKLPSSFDVVSQNGKTARLSLTFSNDKTLDLPFNNEGKDPQDPNYHINFVDYSSTYFFLPNSLTKGDFETQIGDLTASITKVDVYDDSNVVKYSHAFSENEPRLSPDFKDWFRLTLDAYNKESLSYYEQINVQTLERKQALGHQIESIVEVHKANLLPMESETIILKSDRMVWAVTITIVVYTTLAILLGNFLFSFFGRKGIYKNVPKNDGNHLSFGKTNPSSPNKNK